MSEYGLWLESLLGKCVQVAQVVRGESTRTSISLVGKLCKLGGGEFDLDPGKDAPIRNFCFFCEESVELILDASHPNKEVEATIFLRDAKENKKK